MESLRSLPSVDEVLRRLKRLDNFPLSLITDEVRAELGERRQALLSGSKPPESSIEDRVERRLKEIFAPTLRPVINATGVILHTNLGRAPLVSLHPIKRYSNLEYDLNTGKRGKRDVHTANLLARILGKPAIVVNNNAAAVYLVLSELAAGYEVIVSRGELIEIGEGFRIPEIMARSGSVIREVGTTNRTRIEDYVNALNERTRLILRVHPSNFRVTGFVARPELRELALLGRNHGIPVYEDIGSGCLVDFRPTGIEEPRVADSLAAGVNLVSFSCDKLMGGPQAGIIAGDADLVQRIRRNPMYRTFRVDKLIIEALQATLRNVLAENWEAIPTLQMIFASLDKIRGRAERMINMLQDVHAEAREGQSAIGGGSTPDQTLPTWTVELLPVAGANAFDALLRNAPNPVIARIERDRMVLDMRTVADDELESLAATIRRASLVSQVHDGNSGG
jgi:L-seryl-tRNA(Ser) seleniumtransferase